MGTLGPHPSFCLVPGRRKEGVTHNVDPEILFNLSGLDHTAAHHRRRNHHSEPSCPQMSDPNLILEVVILGGGREKMVSNAEGSGIEYYTIGTVLKVSCRGGFELDLTKKRIKCGRKSGNT